MLARTFGPRRGADELRCTLNAVYDALIGEVDGYGGSVIAFAGDAITCWFDGDDGLRATACGLAMQAAMQASGRRTHGGWAGSDAGGEGLGRRRPGPAVWAGDPTVRLMDVLAGKLWCRWRQQRRRRAAARWSLDGPTAAALGRQIRITSSKTSGRAARLCRGRRVRGALRIGPSPAPLPLLSDAATRPWLIPAVHARLRAGLGEFLTELRPAVACFVKFDGIDYDGDEAAGQKLSRFVSWIQRLLEPFEGCLLDINVGDKGSYLYYAFGAPMAHEDDSRRALTVARYIRQASAEFSYIHLIQVGINRGTMRTGAYGGQRRRTYGVLGDDVNLAARLMEKAAPGQVLVSGKVQADCATEFTGTLGGHPGEGQDGARRRVRFAGSR
jgi:class 3 adenylate cyclase